MLDQRRRKGVARIERGESAMINLDDEKSVTAAYETERRHAVLRDALVELRTTSKTDPKTIKAFEMLAYHGLAPQVVATELGMSTHDVYAKLREIVLRLEREYEEEPGEWESDDKRPSAGLSA